MDNKAVSKRISEDAELFINNSMVLEKLKDEYREIIILRHVEGYSIEEIAKILEKSKSNVRVMIHRALKILKEMKILEIKLFY